MILRPGNIGYEEMLFFFILPFIRIQSSSFFIIKFSFFFFTVKEPEYIDMVFDFSVRCQVFWPFFCKYFH
jgi:hypothetical protein